MKPLCPPILAIIGASLAFYCILFSDPLEGPFCFIIPISALIILVALIAGIANLIEHIIKGEIKSYSFLASVAAIFLSVSPIMLALSTGRDISFLGKQQICYHRLISISIAISQYSNKQNGSYPETNDWCDLLVKNTNSSEKMFRCPNDETGPSSYAINSNAIPASPNDVVLVFESRPGWNLYGGSELLNAENHKGLGANILFADGSVKWIEKEDFNNLNWGNDLSEPNDKNILELNTNNEQPTTNNKRLIHSYTEIPNTRYELRDTNL